MVNGELKIKTMRLLQVIVLSLPLVLLAEDYEVPKTWFGVTVTRKPPIFQVGSSLGTGKNAFLLTVTENLILELSKSFPTLPRGWVLVLDCACFSSPPLLLSSPPPPSSSAFASP